MKHNHSLLTFWSRHAASSFEKQHHLIGLIEQLNWRLSPSAGTLEFSNQFDWNIHIIVSESFLSDTWLWAWANTESNIPDHLLHASLALKAYGVKHGIPELTTPELPLSQIDGHTLALLASGICDADAYYRCPYEGGALYVLIMDDDFPECPDPPLQRIATVFPQAIASLDIPDHEEALCGYLDDYDLEHEHAGNQIIVRDEGGESVLTATFDEQKRLTNLEVRLEAQADGHDEGAPLEDRPEASQPREGAPTESPGAASWDDAQFRRLMGG